MPLVTVRTMDTNKIIRQTNILLKIFICFDIFFIVSFLVQLVWLSSIYLGGFQDSRTNWNLQFLTNQKFVHGYCFIGFPLCWMVPGRPCRITEDGIGTWFTQIG